MSDQNSAVGESPRKQAVDALRLFLFPFYFTSTFQGRALKVLSQTMYFLPILLAK